MISCDILMGKLLVIFVCVSALQWVAFGDIYMHNPRGSNDRNCERTVNRQNGNRLFNSQNNNNGGYACPRGVGDETFQAENGDVVFNSVDTLLVKPRSSLKTREYTIMRVVCCY